MHIHIMYSPSIELYKALHLYLISTKKNIIANIDIHHDESA